MHHAWSEQSFTQSFFCSLLPSVATNWPPSTRAIGAICCGGGELFRRYDFHNAKGGKLLLARSTSWVFPTVGHRSARYIRPRRAVRHTHCVRFDLKLLLKFPKYDAFCQYSNKRYFRVFDKSYWSPIGVAASCDWQIFSRKRRAPGGKWLTRDLLTVPNNCAPHLVQLALQVRVRVHYASSLKIHKCQVFWGADDVMMPARCNKSHTFVALPANACSVFVNERRAWYGFMVRIIHIESVTQDYIISQKLSCWNKSSLETRYGPQCGLP